MPTLNSFGSSCALMKSYTMSSSSDRLHLTSNELSAFTGGSCAMNFCTFSCISRLSCPFAFTAISSLVIWSMAFSILLLDLAMSFTFSAKNPCLFSPAVISSEPDAIVFMVSVIVFLYLTFGNSSKGMFIFSPHYEIVECMVLLTSYATLLTTDSKRWNRYKYRRLLFNVFA